jgi:predicted dehydrogenase
VGCGSRGEIYASYGLQHPDRARVVGVCELRSATRARLVEIHRATIETEKVFADWRLISQPGLVDSVVIALPDREHKSAAVHFMSLGYHILLEKPMATLLDDCKQIVVRSREMNKDRVLINAVSHVLRYFEPCRKIKEVIDSGLIGDVVNINHTEPVGKKTLFLIKDAATQIFTLGPIYYRENTFCPLIILDKKHFSTF